MHKKESKKYKISTILILVFMVIIVVEILILNQHSITGFVVINPASAINVSGSSVIDVKKEINESDNIYATLKTIPGPNASYIEINFTDNVVAGSVSFT